MRLPIDTVAVQFMSAGPAKPVVDFDAKAPRLDANGQPLYSVNLFAISTAVMTPSRSKSPASPRASATSRT